MFVIIKKYKIDYSQDHVRKPQHVRNNKELTKWNPIVKNCMYDMIAVDWSVLQPAKYQNINNAVNNNNKSVSIFVNKTLHNVTFLV